MQRVADQGNSSPPEQADFPVRLGVSQLLCRVLGLLALTLAPLVALTPLPTRLARAAAMPASLPDDANERVSSRVP